MMTDPHTRPLAGVHVTELPGADAANRALRQGFARENSRDDVRRTHSFNGRFENIYIAGDRLPELRPVSDFALSTARHILERDSLRMGCWFNAMPPGHSTTLHTHEEEDELLSAVYYIHTPANCGRLVLHHDQTMTFIEPRAGLLVVFPPGLPHEVERNDSEQTRLSVAFNFGPTSPPP